MCGLGGRLGWMVWMPGHVARPLYDVERFEKNYSQFGYLEGGGGGFGRSELSNHLPPLRTRA